MSAPLRIVFFGTGGRLSADGLRALAPEHDVLAVVRAVRRRGGALRRLAGRMARRIGLRPSDALESAARDVRVRQWPLTSARDPRFAEQVRALRPDLLCVAHFPWRLPDDVLGAAGLGGINLHASLLPRHRGPLPLFWIYHADDRETGVTVHHMTGEFDGGDIIGQRAFPLARGRPVDDLNADNARVGAEVLRESVRALAVRAAPRRPQDDTQATAAPLVHRGDRLVDFERWDVERVWHFLSGLYPRFVEPLVDAAGERVVYGGVAGFERATPQAPPGTVHRIAAGRFTLQCQDGVVRLSGTTGPTA